MLKQSPSPGVLARKRSPACQVNRRGAALRVCVWSREGGGELTFDREVAFAPEGNPSTILLGSPPCRAKSTRRPSSCPDCPPTPAGKALQGGLRALAVLDKGLLGGDPGDLAGVTWVAEVSTGRFEGVTAVTGPHNRIGLPSRLRIWEGADLGGCYARICSPDRRNSVPLQR